MVASELGDHPGAHPTMEMSVSCHADQFAVIDLRHGRQRREHRQPHRQGGRLREVVHHHRSDRFFGDVSLETNLKEDLDIVVEPTPGITDCFLDPCPVDESERCLELSF